MSEKIFLKDITLPITETGENETYYFVQTDDDLEKAGDAADAKKTGDEITSLKQDLTQAQSDLLASQIVNSASGAVASFPDGADNLPVRDLVIDINPVQAGSGDPAPDNVRPISGWTGAKINRTAENIWGGTLLRDGIKAAIAAAEIDNTNKTIEFGAGATATKRLTDDCGISHKFKENTQYTLILAGYNTNASSALSNMRVYYTDGTSSAMAFPTNEKTKQTLVFVTTSGKTVDSISKTNQSSYTILYYDECGLFEGVLTAQDFTPYVGTTYPISWSDEAGTVYGGTLDVTSGVLTVTHWGFDGGDVEWTKAESSYQYGNFYTPATGNNLAYSVDAQVSVMSSIYKGFSQYAISASDTGVWLRAQSGTIKSVYVKDDTKSELTAEQFQSAMTGVTFLYKLATSAYKTYQLTPTEVKTLLGQNNIWAVTGDSTVQYPADPKLYVDGNVSASQKLMELIITANRENGTTASKAYTAGDLVIINGTLYSVASNIANGGTFTIGTNVVATTIAAQLAALS